MLFERLSDAGGEAERGPVLVTEHGDNTIGRQAARSIVVGLERIETDVGTDVALGYAAKS